MSRRPGARFNRGRIAAFPGGYSAPRYPSFLDTTGGAFYWAEDITDPAVWTPLFDSIGAGNMTGVNTTLEATGWVQPEGNSKSMRIASASSAYLRCDALASLATADDAPLTFSLGYQTITTNAANALVSWSSSSSATPKRVCLYTTGVYRWTQQTTTVVSALNTNVGLQQMLVLRQINNGAGTTTTFTRNVETDTAAALTMNVGSQAVNVFTIGAQWNGVSGPTNFANIRVKWFLILPSGVAMTAAQELELENWVLGAYAVAPLYSAATQYLLIISAGQSNSALQGIATGAIAGMPDADVKKFWRNINNDADDPTALSALDRRIGANSYSSYAQFIPTGSFAVPHHMCGVGQGATTIGNWLTAGGTHGLYSTALHSELRRIIHQSKIRFGGAPIIIFDWNQGENDAAAGPIVAAAYQGSLTTLETEVRAMVNTAWNDSTFAFHVLQLSDSQTGGGIVAADRDTIQLGVVAWVALGANRYESNTDAVPCVGTLHFNTSENAARAAIAIAKFKAIDANL